MGFLIRIGLVIAGMVVVYTVFGIFVEMDLEEWFFRILAVGLILPFCMDFFQGNQVRLFRGEHGKGVCETLQSDAYVVTLFVNDKESSWSAEEIENFMEFTVKDGLAYIEFQAQNYGENTEVKFGCYRENGMAKTVTLEQQVNNRTGLREWDALQNRLLLHKAARKLGYANAWHMLSSDRKTTGMKQIAYLVCINKPGRSYAVNDRNEAFFYDKPEYSVVFSHYPSSDIKTSSRTVGHEVLHLFGAEDYYEEDGERERRSRLAEKLCPTDIMYHTSVNIWETSVGGFTAYTVGWLDHMPEEYKLLGWWY